MGVQMKRLFSDKIMSDRLNMEITEWLGTPYKYLGRHKKRGTDCILFILYILKDIGIFNNINPIWYPRDWYIQYADDFVLNMYLENRSNLRSDIKVRVFSKDFINPEYGDVLTFARECGRITQHAAIYISKDKIVHCINNRGVVYSQYGKWLSNRLTRVVRFYRG